MVHWFQNVSRCNGVKLCIFTINLTHDGESIVPGHNATNKLICWLICYVLNALTTIFPFEECDDTLACPKQECESCPENP